MLEDGSSPGQEWLETIIGLITANDARRLDCTALSQAWRRLVGAGLTGPQSRTD